MINSIVSFGKLFPTKDIIDLVSARNGVFDNNVRTISALSGNKIDVSNVDYGQMRYIFDAVGSILYKQIPKLETYGKKISKLQSVKNEDLSAKKLAKIMDSAEKQLGKNLDISTEAIEKYISIIL